MHKKIDPVSGKIFTVFFRYAVPSIFGMLAMSLAVVIDGLFVGKYVGTVSLAAINLTIPANGLLFGIALMLSVGGAIRCGKFLGENKFQSAGICFSQTMVFIVFISLLITAAGLFFIDKVVFLLGANEVTATPLAEYLSILLFFIVFQLGAIGLSYFVRVDNFPIWASAALIAGSVVNIGLDWLFVVRYGLGHKGAALGTGLAEVTAFFLLSLPFFTKQARLKLKWRGKDIPELLKVVVNGFPEFSNEFSVAVVMFIFNWLIMKKLGETGIAAFSIVNYMILCGLVISYGISDFLQPVVSQNYGARKHRRVRNFVLISTLAAFASGVGISILLATKSDFLTGLFIRHGETETARLTVLFISRIWPIFLLNGVNIILASYLAAVHRSFDSSLVILAKNLLLPLLILFIIKVCLKHDAILVVLPISELVAFFIALFFLFRHNPIMSQKKTVAGGC
jgi:putative MATE family efflux protein